MGIKIVLLLKTTAIFLLAVVFESYGQTTSIGARFTTSLYRAAFVENPSPSNIYGPRHSSIDIGVYGLRYFKGEQWGVKMGLELGLIPWLLRVDAPRNAFGTGDGGDQLIQTGIGGNDFSYKSITISAAYKVPLKNRFLEISAGTSVRDYAFGDGSQGLGFAFNRTVPYDPDDPSHGPPDVDAELEPLDDEFHISFPITVDYVFSTGKRSQLKFGIMNNIAIKPLSKSELTVIMYGETYKGKFSPRTSFWGVNAVFEYGLSRKAGETFHYQISQAELIGKYKKALFVENHGSGIFLTGNFDTRLKKDVNDGFGVKLGIGKGRGYHTEITNNNKPTERSSISLPVGVNYILGKKRHGIEAGIGVTAQIALDKVVSAQTTYKDVYFPYYIGYRYQPIKEGLVARVAWTPLYTRSQANTNFDYIYYNTGISIGYSFR